MSYLKRIEWEIIPDSKPEVIKNCPKCSEKMNFINTGKFRINANKSLVDVWLIYQCSKCKSTYNMAIYERINPNNINHEEYEKLLANDRELADKYGFDIPIHNKNKAELVLDCLDYHVIPKDLPELGGNEKEYEIKISCKYPIQLRVDKLLSEQLNITRSEVKNLYQKGLIYSLQSKNLLKAKVEDNMIIYIKEIADKNRK